MNEFPDSSLTSYAIQSECWVTEFSAVVDDVTDLLSFWIGAYKRMLFHDKNWTEDYFRNGVEEQVLPTQFLKSLKKCNELLLPEAQFELPRSPVQCVAIAVQGVMGFGTEQAYICRCEDGFWGVHTGSSA